MKLQVLVAGVAMLALSAGGASAATHRHHVRRHHPAWSQTRGRYALPPQPIAYSKLNAYLKATPSQRAHGDWTNDTTTAAAAPTGNAVNAAAAPAPGAPGSASAAGQMGANAGAAATPPAGTNTRGAAVPPSNAAPGGAATSPAAPNPAMPPQSGTAGPSS
ncbi:MAG TPA: hypothetical protein VMU93_14415 [Caulobacteraceae bacterium]|nr:hypothetical protein [Caulobacteraceae bacterium]